MNLDLNKNQMTMAVIGGCAGVAALVVGFLAFSARSERKDAEAACEEQYERYSSNATATEQQRGDIESNAKTLRKWMATTLKSIDAPRGSEPPEGENYADFQIRVRKERDRYGALPADEKVKLVDLAQQGNGVVFEDIETYLCNDEKDGERAWFAKMTPADKLRCRQRQWRDISHFADLLLKHGAIRLDKARICFPAVQAKGRGSSASSDDQAMPFDCQQYTFEFTARSEALVKVLNELGGPGAFTAIDSLLIEPERDPLAAIMKRRKDLASAESPETESSGDEEIERMARMPLLTDPENPRFCAPFKVKVTFTTLAPKKPAKAEEEN